MDAAISKLSQSQVLALILCDLVGSHSRLLPQRIEYNDKPIMTGIIECGITSRQVVKPCHGEYFKEPFFLKSRPFERCDLESAKDKCKCCVSLLDLRLLYVLDLRLCEDSCVV